MSSIDQYRQEKKKKKREEKKRHLMSLSQQRVQLKGAPDFGAKEGDILAMKAQIQQLTVANNALVQEVEQYRKANFLEKIQEIHYMVGVLARLMCEAKAFPITTEEDFKLKCRQSQMVEAGLKDKTPGQPLEEGDTLIMGFKLYEGEKEVDDQMRVDMGYVVGSKGLPCDDGMIGMHIGESRFFDVVFGNGLVRTDLVGKALRMLVLCKGIKVKESSNIANKL